MKNEYVDTITFMWVKDWDRSIAFYEGVLGFRKVYESEGWAELAIPGITQFYLAINRWAATEEMPLNSFVTLRVKDLNAFRDRLAERKVKLKGEIQEFVQDDQGLRLFKFFDPDGNLLTACEML